MAIPLRLKKTFRKYLIYSGIILALLLLLLMIKGNVVKILVATALIIIASFSKIYKRWTTISIGFELITPVTILFAYRISIVFAIIAAIFMVLLADFISGRLIPMAMVFQWGAYLIISIVAGSLNMVDFIPLAIVLIIFRDVFLFLTQLLFVRIDPVRATLSTVPNVLINIFLVTRLGPFFVALLAIK